LNTHSKIVTKIKFDLDSGDIRSALAFLTTQATESDLETLKNQKILLRCKDPKAQQELADTYKNATTRLGLDSQKATELKNYAQFTTIAIRIFSEITDQVTSHKQAFDKISMLDLLEVASEVLLKDDREYWESMWTSTENNLRESDPEHRDNSDLTEWTLHEISGHINDMAFSVCRAINEASRWVNHNKRGVSGQALRQNATNAFRPLVTLASKWNAIEYALDRVSYGEWNVKFLNPDIPEITFDQVDVRLLRARTIGIRRQLVTRYFGRTFSPPARQIFENICHTLTQKALTFYEAQTRSIQFSFLDSMSLSKKITKLLDFLDTEDEFLILSALKDDYSEIMAHYLAVIGLQTCSLVVAFIKEKLPHKYHRKLLCPVVPINLIVDAIALTDLQRQAIYNAISKQIITLPINHYLDLMARPYVQLTNGKAISLDALSNVNWASNIRGIVEGGAIADTYGKIWEMYVKDLLKRYNWRIIGHGIKLKNKQGLIATDIDILALKNDMLLVIQVKAIFSEGITPYDQWKAREIIVKGTNQAKIAYEILTSDHDRIISIIGKRAFSNINYIQPLVITNDTMFTGWNHNDIPTISVKALISHLRGAIVEFKNLKGEIVDSQRFSQEDSLTSKEFIDLLKNPLDWRIAKDSDAIEYVEANMDIIKCYYPSLKRVDHI